MPLLEVGPPTSANGYRPGIYVFTCDYSYGSHTETSADSTNDLGESACQNAPYLGVLGEQIPGTDEEYCSPRYANLTRAQPADSPDVVTMAGVFRIHNEGSYDVYSTRAATSCFVPHPFGTIPFGYVEVGGTRVEYLTCNY